uniref:Uncharacterized protein n=1 Tax=Romanomermis culicivorax TaxID=13658 RepID=A0A915HU45_ROMCU
MKFHDLSIMPKKLEARSDQSKSVTNLIPENQNPDLLESARTEKTYIFMAPSAEKIENLKRRTSVIIENIRNFIRFTNRRLLFVQLGDNFQTFSKSFDFFIDGKFFSKFGVIEQIVFSNVTNFVRS